MDNEPDIWNSTHDDVMPTQPTAEAFIPGTNGVKTIAASGWDPSISQEYVFGRCNKWLTQYMGQNHGVTCAVSEYGFTDNNANVTSVSYASVLGTFANNNVTYFSPWYWYHGMWETLHLFSRYGKTTRVASVSGNEQNVSGYSSINAANDSMTVILVNRNLTNAETVNLNISNFVLANGTYTTKQLSGLPVTETFTSHTTNALNTGSVTIASNSLNITLPSLSTTAILFKDTGTTSIKQAVEPVFQAKLYPNPVSGQNAFIHVSGDKTLNLKLEIYNAIGQMIYGKDYTGQAPALIEIPCANFNQGVYTISLSLPDGKKWILRLVNM